MPFEKGHKLAKGRPKGSLNKRTIERMEMLDKVFKLLDKGLLKDIPKLKESERVNLWKELLEYIISKQQRQQIDLTSKGDKIQPLDLSKLSDVALNELTRIADKEINNIEDGGSSADK